VALAFFILSRASSFALVMSAALILGLGGGGLNGATNALTNDIHPEKRSSALNLLGIFFGFGALSIPFLIGSLLKLLRLDSILLFATGLSLIPLILFSIFIFPKPKQPQGFPLKEASLVGRNPLLWLCAFLLFFQSGNEFTLGGWISTYFHERLGLTAMAASFVLAGYWAAIMFGRLGASQIVKRMKNEKLVLLSAILSFGSAFVLYISRSVALSCAGAVFVGLGFAAIYPTTLAVIGGNFAAFSGTAFSVTFGIALCGGMLSPWLTGKVAQASGMGRAMLIPLFNCLMIILIQSVIMSVLRKRPGSRVSG
jgi:fucose permease